MRLLCALTRCIARIAHPCVAWLKWPDQKSETIIYKQYTSQSGDIKVVEPLLSLHFLHDSAFRDVIGKKSRRVRDLQGT